MVTSTNVGVTLVSHASVAVAAGKTSVAGHSMGEVTAGQVMTGAVVSSTQMVWVQLDELPEQSVAVQVRVTQYSCGHEPGVVTSANVTSGAGSQASTAVAGGNTGAAGHSMGEAAAGQVITGAVVSTTVMS